MQNLLIMWMGRGILKLFGGGGAELDAARIPCVGPFGSCALADVDCCAHLNGV